MAADLRIKFNADTSSLASQLKGISGVMQAAMGSFAVTQLAGAMRSVAEFAGSMQDAAEQTGFSVRSIQQWNYAASQAGATMADVTTGIRRFQDVIGQDEPTKAQAEALARLGLKLNDLKTMRPEDAFRRVAEAVGRVGNESERTSLAMELFGRAGVKVAAIGANFSRTIESFTPASDKAIKAAAEFDDRWAAATITMKTWGAVAMGVISEVAEAMGQASVEGGFFSKLTDPKRYFEGLDESKKILDREKEAQDQAARILEQADRKAIARRDKAVANTTTPYGPDMPTPQQLQQAAEATARWQEKQDAAREKTAQEIMRRDEELQDAKQEAADAELAMEEQRARILEGIDDRRFRRRIERAQKAADAADKRMAEVERMQAQFGVGGMDTAAEEKLASIARERKRLSEMLDAQGDIRLGVDTGDVDKVKALGDKDIRLGVDAGDVDKVKALGDKDIRLGVDAPNAKQNLEDIANARKRLKELEKEEAKALIEQGGFAGLKAMMAESPAARARRRRAISDDEELRNKIQAMEQGRRVHLTPAERRRIREMADAEARAKGFQNAAQMRLQQAQGDFDKWRKAQDDKQMRINIAGLLVQQTRAANRLDQLAQNLRVVGV